MMRLLIIICCLIGLSWAGKDAKSLCKHKKSVILDEIVIKKHFPKGIYAVMSKNADLTTDVIQPEKPKTDKRKWNKKICFKSSAKIGLTEVEASGECKFNSTNFMSCTGFSGGSIGLGTDLKTFGDGWAVKTDNKTYATFVGCFGNHKPFWLVLANKKTISDEVKEEILEHVVSIGFDKDDVAPEGSPQIGVKIVEKPCDKKGGKNGGGGGIFP